MVKILLVLILACISITVFSQTNLKLFAEKEGDKTVLYAQNNEYCPVSVWLTLTLQNLTAEESPDHVYVIPPNTGRFRLVDLERIKRRRSSYSYSYKAVYGNVYQVDYDRGYLYDLPYRKGLTYRIDQGYNGTFTHVDENALDFNMPEGTQIRAARGGVVIAVVQQYSENCLRDECKKMANYILIYHSDGTIADYSHIQYNGASVAVGDTVKKGDIIAISGNTGYTRGPHLHFICFLPDFEKRRGLETKFRIGNGTTSAYLRENKAYKKNYNPPTKQS